MAKIRFARYVASAGVVGLVGALVAAGSGAGAASAVTDAGVIGDQAGTVKTTVEKVVNQTANASGAITGNTMITQVSAVGNGTMNVQVPLGTSSLRDLDSFSGIATQGDAAVFNQTVNGSAEKRIMSKSNLAPIKVEVSATLDGKPIKPEDVVSKSGVLDVKYKIINTTRNESPITYQDGSGNTVTQNLQTAAPFTGSMEVTLPQGFNEISAPGTTGVAGDGHNGTLLDYTMTLFPPLGDKVPLAGASEVTIGYQSRITNGTLPEAQFSFTPIVPYSDSSVAETKNALATEAADGTKLVQAGNEMGASLAKLTGPSGIPKLVGSLSSGVTSAKSSLSTLLGPVQGTDAMGSAKEIRDKIETSVLGALTSSSNQAQINQLAGIQQLLGGLIGSMGAMLPELIKKEGNACMPPATGTCTGSNTIAGTATQLGNTLIQAVYLTEIPSYIGTYMPMFLGPVATACAAPGSGCETIPTMPEFQRLQAAFPATGTSPLLAQLAPWSEFAALPCGGASGTCTWTWNPDGSGNVPAYVESLASTAIVQLLQLEEVQDLFDAGPQLKTAIGQFVDAVEPMLDQAQATLDAVAPASEPLQALVGDLSEAVPQAEQLSTDANALVAAGPDALVSTGQQITNENAPVIAQLDAMQKMGLEGAGIPYGPAKGSNVTTMANYNLVVAGAGTTAKDNTINWVLGILFLIVAVGIGTALWNRRRSA